MKDELRHHDDYRKCVHFRGIQNECGAGVDPMTVRDITGKGMAKWPCLTLPGREPATTLCPHYRAMTREELDAETAKLSAAVDAFMANLAANKCGHCGQTMTGKKRVGRCEYAEPCGHRLGQLAIEGEE